MEAVELLIVATFFVLPMLLLHLFRGLQRYLGRLPEEDLPTREEVERFAAEMRARAGTRSRQDQTDNVQCGLCLDERMTGPVELLPCGHIYCNGCVQRLWTHCGRHRRLTCPYCQASVEAVFPAYQLRQAQRLLQHQQRGGADPGSNTHRARLVRFMEKHSPARRPTVDASIDKLLAAHAGRENRMWTTLIAKFGPEPEVPGVDDEAVRLIDRQLHPYNMHPAVAARATVRTRLLLCLRGLANVQLLPRMIRLKIFLSALVVVVYVLLPYDLIPDMLGVIGLLDDGVLAVLMLVVVANVMLSVLA